MRNARVKKRFLLVLAGAGGDSFEVGLLASLAYTGLGLYSIIDAPFSAVRANKRTRRQLMLAPTTMRDLNLRPVKGLALTGRF